MILGIGPRAWLGTFILFLSAFYLLFARLLDASAESIAIFHNVASLEYGGSSEAMGGGTLICAKGGICPAFSKEL